MELNLPKEVFEILEKFEKEGLEIYIVGGAVRDFLMGKPIFDWDFTTNATPEKIVSLFNDAYYNNEFGTVGIPAKDKDLRPFEITTFRTEREYKDFRRPEKVEWGESLEEDLKRRDFTINAMALGLNTSLNKSAKIDARVDIQLVKLDLIDFYNGQKDLKNKLIRAVGNPIERFSEDALRMMRAVRIASQLNFKIEKKTLSAIRTQAGLINKIAYERVRDEFFKILSSPNPAEGVILLRETEILSIILPELENCFGVEQKSPQRHHIYDVGTHLIMSLKEVRSNDPILRLAVLIHDIGKPQTFKRQENGTITFYNHEVVGAKIANKIADRLCLSKDQKEKLWRLVRWHQFTVDEDQTDTAIKRFMRKVDPENIEDILELRRADRLGSGARETSWRTEAFKQRLVEVQKEPFTVHDLKVTGHDIIKILDLNPGPKIGDILDKIFKKVESKKIPNERKALLKEVKKYK